MVKTEDFLSKIIHEALESAIPFGTRVKGTPVWPNILSLRGLYIKGRPSWRYWAKKNFFWRLLSRLIFILSSDHSVLSATFLVSLSNLSHLFSFFLSKEEDVLVCPNDYYEGFSQSFFDVFLRRPPVFFFLASTASSNRKWVQWCVRTKREREWRKKTFLIRFWLLFCSFCVQKCAVLTNFDRFSTKIEVRRANAPF